MLIDPQVYYRRRRRAQQRVRGGGERLMRDRPGDPGMPGRLRRGDPPLGDLVRGLLAQPGRDPAPRRQGRRPFGERRTRALLVLALPPHLDPPQLHHVPGAAHVPRPGHHRLVHPARDHAAARACRRSRVIGDRPYLKRAVGSLISIGDLQTLHAEQHGRRILEHDARGFLISDSVVRPEIVNGAGFRITATRCNRVTRAHSHYVTGQ